MFFNYNLTGLKSIEMNDNISHGCSSIGMENGTGTKFGFNNKNQVKIKRSVSYFDANYLDRIRLKNGQIPNSLMLMMDLDNPWKLKRPEPPVNDFGVYNKNANNETNQNHLLAQYLSFEFLNKRIHDRLQQELQYSFNTRWRYSYSENGENLDSNNDNNNIDNDNNNGNGHNNGTLKNFSCSEMNLTMMGKKSQQMHLTKPITKCSERSSSTQSSLSSSMANTSNEKIKRKSFKKFLEHYFINGSNDNVGLNKRKLKSLSSSEELLTNKSFESNNTNNNNCNNSIGTSSIPKFDYNFILKRNTPNAGLNDPNDRFKHSIWKRILNYY